MPFDAAWVIAWARLSADAVRERREELTALDAAIGDGDHGANLDRGLHAAVAALDEAQAAGCGPATPAEALKIVATTLITTVGGAAGPLLGTACLWAARAAQEAGGDDGRIDAAGVARIVREACAGVQSRGRAEPGDKTMADAWYSAAGAARLAADEGLDPVGVLERAARAAAEGAAATDPLQARKGRASYLGERSRDHRDPGAESTAILLAAAARAARRSRDAADGG